MAIVALSHTLITPMTITKRSGGATPWARAALGQMTCLEDPPPCLLLCFGNSVNRNCQSILRKIFKFVATRWHLLRLKCTEFDFGWGSAPQPAAGAYSIPPDLLAGFEEVCL